MTGRPPRSTLFPSPPLFRSCRNRRRTYWERHSSFLFFSPYFFRSSFSALMRSASHGWDGRSNFARENFERPSHPWEAERIKRSEEHTSELQSLAYLVCRLLL